MRGAPPLSPINACQCDILTIDRWSPTYQNTVRPPSIDLARLPSLFGLIVCRSDNHVAMEGKRPKAVFRGGTTGTPTPSGRGWRGLSRAKLVLLARNHSGLLDAAFAGFPQVGSRALYIGLRRLPQGPTSHIPRSINTPLIVLYLPTT